MLTAQLPDMNKGIISVWFRDATKASEPSPDEWPEGMVPPDATNEPAAVSPSSVFFWSGYGMPIIQGVNGPAPVYMPWPPPFAIDQKHLILTFGDPNQSYTYYPWALEFPGVIPAVQYTGSPVPGIGYNPKDWPPPYAPYYINLGDSHGKFRVANYRIGDPVDMPNMIPQSFIGIDKDGYVIICLQTKTKANYKGMAYMLDEIQELWAKPTYLVLYGPPYTYTQVGFPYPDGHWEYAGDYWNGYQFSYKDVSNEVMGAQGETFVLGGPAVFLDVVAGPRVVDDRWHHLLFSFDISGSVTCNQPAGDISARPILHTDCKAWLAVDDVNYNGMALQRRLVLPDGFIAPLLPGMGHDVTPFGPVTSYSRDAFVPPIGDNEIIPQNVWIHGFSGLPRAGLPWLSSASGISTGPPENQYYPAGDFNGLAWTGTLWPLYADVAPGEWKPIMTPPRPTVPDPATFDLPQYECSGFMLPITNHPIGIPASQRHLKHNTGVVMAELQIWANKTIDTTLESNRRLFVDKNGEPTKMEIAEKYLGRPDVRLHGTTDWQKGRNSGRIGEDDKGNVIKSGQFTPIADINKFLPDPSLYGEQSN